MSNSGRTLVATLMSIISIAGCSSNELRADVPALRTSVTEASKTELEDVLSTAMNGVDVSIADDALTATSTLILERGQPRGNGRSPASGRDYGRPDHFQLVLDGPQCLLVHEETGLRWLLTTTRCEPAPIG